MNLDEALKCIKLSTEAFQQGNLDQAEKFLLKSIKLYETPEAKIMLSKLQIIKNQ